MLAFAALFVSTGGWAAEGAAAPNLILVSFDTTRADALSCYGRPPDLRHDPGPVTPTVDGLAAAGLRFERFYAHAPTTLNSHTTLLSGRDPHEHGVPRNGFSVPPTVRTLPERLSEAGWDTLGVAGAAALASTTGIGRGFRVYDDELPHRFAVQYEDRAEGVVDRALTLVEARDPNKPLFLFVHFFDAHAPYDAPGPWAERFVDPAYAGPLRGRGFTRKDLLPALRRGQADPDDLAYAAARYLGEVGYADAQLGRLLAALRTRGLLDRAVVAVTADHGEALSEPVRHAWSHGFDVSADTTRVPLVLWANGVPLGGPGAVRRQAGLRQLAGTLEQLLGLQPTLGDGPTLWDAVRPGPIRDDDGWPARPTWTVFQEATRPSTRAVGGGWNNLELARAVLAGGFRAGGTPWRRRQAASPRRMREQPALRTRAAEPLTWRPATPGIARVLTDLMAAWDRAAPGHVRESMDEATRKALEALGYLDE